MNNLQRRNQECLLEQSAKNLSCQNSKDSREHYQHFISRQIFKEKLGKFGKKKNPVKIKKKKKGSRSGVQSPKATICDHTDHNAVKTIHSKKGKE